MAIAISSAADSAELFAALQSVDISVPLRTEGRTTHHVETRTICRLLSTLAHTQRLSFPVSVFHRDRPDFLLASAIQDGEIFRVGLTRLRLGRARDERIVTAAAAAIAKAKRS